VSTPRQRMAVSMQFGHGQITAGSRMAAPRRNRPGVSCKTSGAGAPSVTRSAMTMPAAGACMNPGPEFGDRRGAKQGVIVSMTSLS
jgi:hypothetical protein